jgi:hypothetical protein
MAYRAVAALLAIGMMVSRYSQRRRRDDKEREEADRKPNSGATPDAALGHGKHG